MKAESRSAAGGKVVCGVWEAFKIFRLFSNYFFAAVSILRATIEAEAITPAIPIKEAAAKVNKFFISDNPFTY